MTGGAARAGGVRPAPDLGANPTRPSRRPTSGEPKSGGRQRVAGYELVRMLGRGGMGTVYLARQVKLNRLVALKELSPPFAGDPEFTERFLRESHLVGSLSHPNVVTVFDYFEDGNLPYIAMEHVARGSLRRFMTGRSPAEIAGILDGILAGLAHAHAEGVVHCDLKPENVLVTADGRVKLGDFGIARAADVAAAGLEGEGRLTGTAAYMAPEMLAREPFDHRADLWSVGVIAHELLTGGVPTGTESTPQAVHGRLVRWAGELLAPSPAQRPQSAEIARDRLEELILESLGARWRKHAGLAQSRGAASEEALAAPVARRRLRPLLLAPAAVAVTVGVAALAYSPGTAPTAERADLHDPPTVAAFAARVRFTGPQRLTAQSAGGPVRVRYSVSARRAGRRLAVRCRPRSGAAFEIGRTSISCVASDAGRRVGPARRVVVVVRPPVLPPARGASSVASTDAPMRAQPSVPEPPRVGFATN